MMPDSLDVAPKRPRSMTVQPAKRTDSDRSAHEQAFATGALRTAETLAHAAGILSCQREEVTQRSD